MSSDDAWPRETLPPAQPSDDARESAERDPLLLHGADGALPSGDEAGAPHKEPQKRGKRCAPSFMHALTFMAGLGGLLFGYDTGVISGALLLIKADIPLTTFEQEVVVSSAIGGAAVGALLGGVLSDRLGRRPVILLASIVFIVGSVVLAISGSLALLVVGRVILGLGIGIASEVVPVYISECSEVKRRGALISFNVFMITSGQCVAYLVDAAFANVTEGWRYMVGLAAVPALVQFIAFIVLPETPRFLLERGKPQEALKSLRRIRPPGSPIEAELAALEGPLRHDRKDRPPQRCANLRKLCRRPDRRALVVGLGLQVFQQLAGINTVMYYSSTIIKMAGFTDTTKAIWISVAVAATNMLMTIVAIRVIDRVGRRRLLLGTLPGVVVSLVLLGVSFYVASLHSPPISPSSPGRSAIASPLLPSQDSQAWSPARSAGDDACAYSTCWTCVHSSHCGFCGAAAGHGDLCIPGSSSGPVNTTIACSDGGFLFDACPNTFGWLAVLSLVLYLVFFAPGMGPTPWTVNGEIYSIDVRGTANGLAAFANWVSNLLISLTFLTLTEYVTELGAFLIYAGFTIIAIIFIARLMPETKGRTLEEIQRAFGAPPPTLGTDSAALEPAEVRVNS